MSEIKINIDDSYLQDFLKFLKTLNYVEVKKITETNNKTLEQNSNFSGFPLEQLPPESPLRKAIKPLRKKVTAEDLILENGNIKTDLEKLRQLAIDLDIQESTEELLSQLSR